MTLPAGTRLGHYEIVAPLGAGGMGEVYSARDSRLGRDVAIKVLPAHLQATASARDRFRREARAVAALQHPAICTVHDVGTTDEGLFYFVMERLQGQTLQQRLASGGALPVAEAVDIAATLADGLDAAHRAGLVHRDVKPANIMLTAHGPKILDFGIAKPLAAGPGEGDETTALLTEQGAVVGTAAYMSPEQLRGEAVDARSDLFSLGLVIYEMLAGHSAFGRATIPMTTAAVLHETPPALGATRAGIPESLEQVVNKAIDKDRSLRYQHASEVRTDLLRLKRAEQTSGGTVARPAPGRVARAPVKAVLAAGLVLAIAGAGYLFFGRGTRVTALTDKDTLVLADFRNSTGDEVFDETLLQGLVVQLQQSPFLSIVPDARARQVLPLMGQPANARLTPELAREVCERMSSTAVVEGSIASLGSQYVLGLNARDCRSGNVLFGQQAQAARKEDVLDALSKLASAFRTSAGESLATVERYSTPLAEATTASLDALKAYSDAFKTNFVEGPRAGLPLMERAVEIDPQFALAHAMLGLTYSNNGENTKAARSAARAYELRDRTTERERFNIVALYHRQVTGNMEKARQAFELWAQTYPRQADAHALLAGHSTQGTANYQEAIDESEKTIAIDPDYTFAYANMAAANLSLNRFDEARQALDRAFARKLALPYFHALSYYLAFHDGDRTAMEASAALLEQRDPGLASNVRSLSAACDGRVRDAIALAGKAVEIAQADQHLESAATYAGISAAWQSWIGRASDARREAQAALALSRGRDVEYAAGLALATVGDGHEARAILSDLEKRYPEDTSARYAYVPAIRAQIALAEHRPAAAIDALQAAQSQYELAQPFILLYAAFGGLHTAYLRGLAYLELGKGAEAAAEFQRVLDHPGLVTVDPVGVLSRLQLARAYARAGEPDKAKAAYQSFLDRWKDADPDLPILGQARAEFARIH